MGGKKWKWGAGLYNKRLQGLGGCVCAWSEAPALVSQRVQDARVKDTARIVRNYREYWAVVNWWIASSFRGPLEFVRIFVLFSKLTS